MTCHISTYGPTFGAGFDIYICDNGNMNKDSYANICHTYSNNKYTYGNK